MKEPSVHCPVCGADVGHVLWDGIMAGGAVAYCVDPACPYWEILNGTDPGPEFIASLKGRETVDPDSFQASETPPETTLPVSGKGGKP